MSRDSSRHTWWLKPAQMASSFCAQGPSRSATYRPPIDFHHFFSLSAFMNHEPNSFCFLTVSLSLHSPPLRTSSRFLPIEYDGKCEKWFNHIFDSWIAPYLTEILHIWRESPYILTKEHPYLKKLWSFDVHLWVMVCQIGMGYGIWESLANLAGNRLGGHRKVWVTGVYGLPQVWIKTEATVLTSGS